MLNKLLVTAHAKIAINCGTTDNIDLRKIMAGVTGLEPAASGVTGRRSNQLSYTPKREV
jgi:hypothetical protein